MNPEGENRRCLSNIIEGSYKLHPGVNGRLLQEDEVQVEQRGKSD